MTPNSKLTLIGFVTIALAFAATVARAQDPHPPGRSVGNAPFVGDTSSGANDLAWYQIYGG